MRFVIFVISVITCYLLVFVEIIIIVCLKKRNTSNGLYSDLINEEIEKMESNNTILKGRRYAYHPISNWAEIVNKEQYDLIDFFSILHEVSHSEDATLVRYYTMIRILTNIILLPIYYACVCCLNISGKYKIVFSLFMIALSIGKTIFLYIVEKRASKKAFAMLLELIELTDSESEWVKKGYVWAYRSQVVRSLITVPIITMI